MTCDSRCEEIDSGDTGFMVMAATFVMLQTPALGLAQAGIIRRKNALSMLMQVISGFAIGSLLWFAIGFSLTFSRSSNVLGGGFIGNLDHMLLSGISSECCYPDSDATTIPGVLFVTFQMMFAVMVPVIVTGAWAERMDFKAFMVFVTIWPFLVYYPIAHWVWGDTGFLGEWGVVDFAGGLTIHTVTGVAALAATYVLNERMSAFGTSHHSLPLFLIGGVLIWGGWYSFNGGSALKANGQAALAMLNTQLAAAAGGVSFILFTPSTLQDKWPLTEIMNGVFAGLAAVTPGSGFMQPHFAVMVGALGGLGASLWINLVKEKLLKHAGMDDTLDVAALQGVPGIIGSILVGFVAEVNLADETASGRGLLVGGDGTLLTKQLVALLIIIPWVFTWTLLLFQFMRNTVGIDVTIEAEGKGLDLFQTGEQAYDEMLAPLLEVGTSELNLRFIEAAHTGNLWRLKELVKEGAHVDGVDYDNRSALHLAASAGRLEVVKWLDTRYKLPLSSVDKHNNTPLDDAMRSDYSAVVKYLQSRGAKSGKDSTYFKDESILQATSDGNVQLVKKWLTKKDAVHTQDYDRRTALHIAATGGHRSIVTLLMAAGADVTMKDRWGRTPMECARQEKHRRTANLIVLLSTAKCSAPSAPKAIALNVGQPISEEVTPLVSRSSITRDMNHNSLKMVLAAKARLDHSRTVFHERKHLFASGAVPRHLKTETVDLEARALLRASARGDAPEVHLLLTKGADPDLRDYDHRSPLHLASSMGHVEVVRELIEAGCKVNVFDRFGHTPLRDAMDLFSGSPEKRKIVSILRASGATCMDVAMASTLCAAAAAGDMKTIQRIDNEGGDLSAHDYDGRTAMHLAASEGKIEVLGYLLNRGINPCCHDRYEMTPLDDAKREGHIACVKRLLNEGAGQKLVPAAIANTAASKKAL